MVVKTCVRCGRPREKWTARGLCSTCYQRRAVRALYKPQVKFARRGVGNGRKNRPEPEEPTAARPGSAEKLEVLRARAEAEVLLWHPLDGRLPEDGEL